MSKMLDEDVLMLECERLVNEIWAKIYPYKKYIKSILEKGGSENEFEKNMIMMAANAYLQKVDLDEIIDNKYFSNNPDR